ncbi:hypothetical protein GBF38_006572 [Nibea albiflora]|uniref:Uncharacterized protein n=1 Tax=Nibea albiflora TaxID=240163 RepID=A0ACB7EGB8_NIBAL|nr:hypothetical protein GBF38_006572 [Nibea albiflora]
MRVLLMIGTVLNDLVSRAGSQKKEHGAIILRGLVPAQILNELEQMKLEEQPCNKPVQVSEYQREQDALMGVKPRGAGERTCINRKQKTCGSALTVESVPRTGEVQFAVRGGSSRKKRCWAWFWLLAGPRLQILLVLIQEAASPAELKKPTHHFEENELLDRKSSRAKRRCHRSGEQR